MEREKVLPRFRVSCHMDGSYDMKLVNMIDLKLSSEIWVVGSDLKVSCSGDHTPKDLFKLAVLETWINFFNEDVKQKYIYTTILENKKREIEERFRRK